MGSGCAGPYKPGIVDSFRKPSFSGSMFNLGSATSRCKSWWFNGNRTQPSEFLSRIQKWEIYIAFFASKCVFFLQGGFTLVCPKDDDLRGSNEFFQVVDGIPTIFEESSQTWWNFLLGDLQKKLPEVCFLFVARAQSTTGEAWVPQVYAYTLRKKSLIWKKSNPHIFVWSVNHVSTESAPSTSK